MATILAVDDSDSIRQMVSFTLKSAGHHVVEAGNAVLATEKSKKVGSRIDGRKQAANGRRFSCARFARTAGMQVHAYSRPDDRGGDATPPVGLPCCIQ